MPFTRAGKVRKKRGERYTRQAFSDEEEEMQEAMLQQLRALREEDDQVVAAADLPSPPVPSPLQARRRRVLPTPPPGVQPASFVLPVGVSVLSPARIAARPSPPAVVQVGPAVGPNPGAFGLGPVPSPSAPVQERRRPVEYTVPPVPAVPGGTAAVRSPVQASGPSQVYGDFFGEMLAQAKLAWRAEWERERTVAPPSPGANGRLVHSSPERRTAQPVSSLSPAASHTSGGVSVGPRSEVTVPSSTGVSPGVVEVHQVGSAPGGSPPSPVDVKLSGGGGKGVTVPGPAEQSAHHVGTSAVRFATITLDKFDGSSSWESFMVKFKSLAKLGNWTEQEQKIRLINALDGPAVQVIWELDEESTTVQQLLDRLVRQFGTADQNLRYCTELRQLRRGSRTLQQLHLEVCRLMALAYPGASGSIAVTTAIHAFCDALGDATLRCKILESAPDSLEKALTRAIMLEAIAGDKRPCASLERQDPVQPKRYVKALATPQQEDAVGVDKQAKLERLMQDLSVRVNKVLGERRESSRMADERPSRSGQSAGRSHARSPVVTRHSHAGAGRDDREAEYSDGDGDETVRPSTSHTIRGVYGSNRGNGRGNTGQRESGGPQSGNRCFNCDAKGHYSRDCPEPRKSYQKPKFRADEGRPTGDDEDKAALNMLRVMSRKLGAVQSTPPSGYTKAVFLPMEVEGVEMSVMLDTGGEMSVMGSRLFPNLRLRRTNKQLFAANETRMPVLGEAEITIVMGEYCRKAKVLVTDAISELILGIDWLYDNNAIWSFRRSVIALDGSLHTLEVKESTSRINRLYVEENVVLPPRQITMVPAKVVWSDLRPGNEAYIAEPKEFNDGLISARSVIRPDALHMQLSVLNLTDKEAVFKRDDFLLDAVPVQSQTEEVISTQRSATEDRASQAGDVQAHTTLSPHLRKVLANFSDVLTAVQRNAATELVVKNGGLFSATEFDIGRTTLVKHAIDTGDARPFKQPLRKYPMAHVPVIDKRVQEMLDHDIIVPSSSPWASNVVLVKKPTGELRFCIDYRMLNAVTVKDSFPLPRIDACMDAMEGAKWFSTLDLRSGYWQLDLDQASAEKTAFVTRKGQYQFNVLSFGLSNAPAIFQRLMNLVLAGLTWEVCLAFLDDVIVISSTFEEHLERLQLVFDRFAQAGLKLNPGKCKLFQKRVKFLGSIVTEEGIYPDPEKVKAVRDWPVPTELRQVRAFVALASYYRRSMKDFAKIAKPLTTLTKKYEKFVWTAERQAAFEGLKECLVNAPVVCSPREGCPFILDTDASDFALGAVLQQLQDLRVVVIAYASRNLSEPEIAYCTTRKELLGIIYGLKQFRHYLLGQKFQLRTDHSALTTIFRSVTVGQQARWLDLLAEYDFTPVHRAGAQHRNADALSRRPCEREAQADRCKQCRRSDPEDLYSPIDEEEVDIDKGMWASKMLEKINAAKALSLEGGQWRTLEEAEVQQLSVKRLIQRMQAPVVTSRSREGSPAEVLPPVRDTPQVPSVVKPNLRGASRVEVRLGRLEEPAVALTRSDSSHAYVDLERIRVRDGVSAGDTNVRLPLTQAAIALAQRSDRVTSQVMVWLEESSDELDFAKAAGCSRELQNLWAQAASLTIVDDVLYRRFEDAHGLTIFRQLVAPVALRQDLLRHVHGGTAFGHFGEKKTAKMLQRYAYWYGWKADVGVFVRRCMVCCSYRKGPRFKQGPLQPQPSSGPMEKFHIDLTGPHVRSKHGNVYLLTGICSFTKFLVAVPLRDKTALSVADALVKHVHLVYGVCDILVSDQGTEFINDLSECMNRALGAQRMRTTAYRPSSNGVCEKVHATLHSVFAKVVSDDQRDWDEMVPFVVSAYNNSYHTATTESPFFLMHGRHQRTALDVLLDVPQITYEDVGDYTAQMLERMRKAHELVSDELQCAFGRAKQRYDSRVKAVQFSPAQFVLYTNMASKPGLNRKWVRHTQGPCLILRRINNVNYVVQLKPRGRVITAHIDRLTRYDGDVSAEWRKIADALTQRLGLDAKSSVNSVAHTNEGPTAVVEGLGAGAGAAASDTDKVADPSGDSACQADRPVSPAVADRPAAAQPISDREKVVPAVSRPKRSIVPPRRFTNLCFTRSDLRSQAREVEVDRPARPVNRPIAPGPRAGKHEVAIFNRHFYVQQLPHGAFSQLELGSLSTLVSDVRFETVQERGVSDMCDPSSAVLRDNLSAISHRASLCAGHLDQSVPIVHQSTPSQLFPAKLADSERKGVGHTVRLSSDGCTVALASSNCGAAFGSNFFGAVSDVDSDVNSRSRCVGIRPVVIHSQNKHVRLARSLGQAQGLMSTVATAAERVAWRNRFHGCICSDLSVTHDINGGSGDWLFSVFRVGERSRSSNRWLPPEERYIYRCDVCQTSAAAPAGSLPLTRTGIMAHAWERHALAYDFQGQCCRGFKDGEEYLEVRRRQYDASLTGRELSRYRVETAKRARGSIPPVDSWASEDRFAVIDGTGRLFKFFKCQGSLLEDLRPLTAPSTVSGEASTSQVVSPRSNLDYTWPSSVETGASEPMDECEEDLIDLFSDYEPPDCSVELPESVVAGRSATPAVELPPPLEPTSLAAASSDRSSSLSVWTRVKAFEPREAAYSFLPAISQPEEKSTVNRDIVMSSSREIAAPPGPVSGRAQATVKELLVGCMKASTPATVTTSPTKVFGATTGRDPYYPTLPPGYTYEGVVNMVLERPGLPEDQVYELVLRKPQWPVDDPPATLRQLATLRGIVHAVVLAEAALLCRLDSKLDRAGRLEAHWLINNWIKECRGRFPPPSKARVASPAPIATADRRRFFSVDQIFTEAPGRGCIADPATAATSRDESSIVGPSCASACGGVTHNCN